MEKINQEQFNTMPLAGKRSATGWFATLMTLRVGEGFVLHRDEWKKKQSPLRTLRHIEKKYGWKFKDGKLADGTGWAVMRVG